MELFSVKRYNEETTETKTTNEDNLLQKLLAKAENRKRKHESTISEPEAPAESEETQNDEENKDAIKKEDVDELLKEISEFEIENENENDNKFEILGEDKQFAKPEKVEVVLPPWLAHPTIIETSLPKADDDTPPEDLSDAVENQDYLKPFMKETLKNMKIKRLFPVQTTVIPWIISVQRKPIPFRPRDICVSAPTGSGKTLAFAVPVVQLLEARLEPKVYALVVLPVAELALQVYKVFTALCKKTVLKVCLLSNQTPFEEEQEKLVQEYKGVFYSKVDIVVSTPGRLVEHLHETKGFCLKSLKFIVIDEADRVMDAFFQNWLYHLDMNISGTSSEVFSGRAPPLNLRTLELTYHLPHKLLFSATLSQDPEKLQDLRLFHPKLFTSVLPNIDELAAKLSASALDEENQKASGQFIGKYTTPAELTEKYCITETRVKPLTLFSLIKEQNWNKFLCFTNSAQSAERLAFVLTGLFMKTENREFVIKELSANMDPKKRSSTLNSFARGQIHGLIASDALARGIDVQNVDIVVSYDQPRHAKTYIHRIGRTARAGRKGTAITLLTQNELEAFNKMLGEVGKKLVNEITVSPTAEIDNASIYTEVLDQLRAKLEKEKKKIVTDKTRFRRDPMKFKYKNPETLTVMEKLQLDASKQTESITESSEQKSKSKVNKTKPVVQKTKFNINAGKNKPISK